MQDMVKRLLSTKLTMPVYNDEGSIPYVFAIYIYTYNYYTINPLVVGWR